MSDESLSKRARQKQRREAKLAEQRVQQSKSRRNRMLMFALAGLVVLALIGLFVLQRIQANQRLEDLRAETERKLAQLGCTQAEEQEDAGAGHFGAAEEITANPPVVAYANRPPTSGRHHPTWVKNGFYDVRVDERYAVHNLEHGYVVIWYDDGASEDDMTALRQHVESAIGGRSE